MVMVGSPADERLNPLGVFLALISALLYSAYLPALERVQQGVPALLSTLFLVAGAAVSFLITGFLAGKLNVPIAPTAWANIVLLALVSTVIAFAALIKGLAVLGPVRTAIIATIEPFFTAILGVVVLGNSFTVSTLVGGGLIGAAILLIEGRSIQLRTASYEGRT
jgi:drug/metabolite transporter (DMT)-like permease